MPHALLLLGQRMHAARPHSSVLGHQRQGPPCRPVANAAQGLGYWLGLNAS